MVRPGGLELPTFWFVGAPGGTRTPDLLVRSQTLYPTELRARRVRARRIVYRRLLRASNIAEKVGQFR